MSDERHPDMDYSEHEATYANFLKLCKWGIGLTIGLLILMAIFLIDTPMALVLIGGGLLVAILLYMM